MTSVNTKYFDQGNIHDCCNELYRSEVKGKVYRLLYTLYKNSRIRVRTSVGVSESEETGPCLTRGSVEGAVQSALNIDNGVKDFFHVEPNEPKNNNDPVDDPKFGHVVIILAFFKMISLVLLCQQKLPKQETIKWKDQLIPNLYC